MGLPWGVQKHQEQPNPPHPSTPSLLLQCAVRYGTVPVVAAVGGLKDLVTPDVGYTLPPLGLSSSAEEHRQNVQNLLSVVRLAASEYGSEGYRGMQRRCMERDVSWGAAAGEWEELLLQLARSRLG